MTTLFSLPSSREHPAATLRRIGGSQAAVAARCGPRQDGGRLWLHLHLPQLPLEVRTRGVDSARACVLVDGGNPRSRVLLTNPRAAACGIRVGMPLAAAHALGELVVIERDTRAEQQALQQLCLWAVQFTAIVSAVPPDGLVLEIKGSLRLFGGLQGLLLRLRQGLRELGYRTDYAVAPTPLAAAALARSEPRTVLQELHQLGPGLARLPLAALRLEPAMHQALEQLGVRQIGDCRRLPRGGLARRLSPTLVQMLDRLFGQVVDLRPAFELPRRFDGEIDLPWEVTDTRGLMRAVERLLHELHGYLVANAAVTRQLRWRLIDRQGGREDFQVNFTRAGSDCRQMLLLMRETLARKRLPIPIRAISLRVDDLTSGVAPPTRDLFVQRSSEHDEAYAGFIDRLRARCGEQVLRSLRLQGGHRPERASAWQRPLLSDGHRGTVPASATPRSRHPLWLLERPLRLAVCGDRPVFDGPLRLYPERERIQSGWWDESGIDRDYFVATTDRGGRLWIYRELEGGRRWYLHGIFD